MIPGLSWINTLKVNGPHHGIPYILSHLILLTAHGPLHGNPRMDYIGSDPGGILYSLCLNVWMDYPGIPVPHRDGIQYIAP